MKNLLSKLSVLILTLGFTSSAFAQDAWIQTADHGFGHAYNSTIFGMNVFNGEIYAATGSDSGYVYRSASGNPNSWTRVFASPVSQSINAINSTTANGGSIYIAANSLYDTSWVMRSTDGTTWSRYLYTSYKVSHIIPFKGVGSVDSIYVVENHPAGSLIYKSASDSNDPLNLGGAWDTVLNMSLISAGTRITSVGISGSVLYAGTNTGELYSSVDGNTWNANPAVGYGFGNPNNSNISAIGSFSGVLFVATENNYDGAQIWSSNDGGVTWAIVKQYSSAYAKVSNLNIGDNKLWATVRSQSSAGQVWYTSDGVAFMPSNTNGFGTTANNGNDASTVEFGNNIYWGGEFYAGGGRGTGFGGAQVWRKCTVAPPIVDLGPDQIHCPGLTVTLDAGPNGAAYLWSDGTTNQTDEIVVGSFYVQYVSSTNGCSAMDTVKVNLLPAPAVGIINPPVGPMMPVTVCEGTITNVVTTTTSNSIIPMPPIHQTANAFISDTAPITYDTINVSGLTTACACDALMSVTIDSLYHTYSADLNIGLYSPSGSYISLAQGLGGESVNSYIGTEFRMDAQTPIGIATPPFTGQFIPQGAFQTLSGDPNGGWILSIQDGAGGDDGYLKGWTIRFKTDDTVMTYSWTPATGLNSTTIANPVVTSLTSTTYTFTTTNSDGCSTAVEVGFNVPHLSFKQAADTVCFGGSLPVNVNGGSPTTTWSPATDLSVALGDAVIASPSVSTTYYVADTVAGCILADSIYIYANPELVLTSPAPVSICANDTATLTASTTGGSAPYNYIWSGSTENGPTLVQQLSNNTTYTITVVDMAGCAAYGSTFAAVTPSTDIYGHVSYSGGGVTGSNVVLYKYLPYLTHFDTVQVTTTDAAGDYYFPSVDHAGYLIKVFPDAAYTTLVPTYFGNVFLWDSATIVSHDCSAADTFNIVTVEETGIVGPGSLQGTILEDVGFGRVPGDPIPGVDVKLGRNPGSQLVTSTQTDNSGNYSFTGLDYGSYTIYADIPGLGRDSSYTVTLDATTSDLTNLDYFVDSTEIFIVNSVTTGITPAGTTTKVAPFSVYPNPSNGNASIEYSITDDAVVSLGIYDVLGVKVIDLVNDKQMPGTYKYNVNSQKEKGLSSGVYFVSLTINGKTDVHRLVINK